MTPKISWLQNLYCWEKLEDDFFTIEDWININGNVQLIKFDPKVASVNMFVAANIKFLGDFRLYQCDSPSTIRSNFPIRFFYNRIHGKFYELKGDNVPFYSVMTFLTGIDEYEKITRLDQGWLNNIFSYVKIFFDNVKGRHGRFEIVDDYEIDLMNRIKTFETYSGKKIEEPFSLDQKDFQRKIYEYMKSSVPQIIRNKNEVLLKNIFVFFRGSLYISTIVIKRDKKEFGIINMNDEILLDYHYLLREATIDEEDLKKYNNIHLLAQIPLGHFQSSN